MACGLVPVVGRLTQRPEFLAVAQGRRFHTERVSVQGVRREGAEPMRLGFTVTKREGHATERNRIRRRLRAAAALAAVPHAAEAVDIVVIGRRLVLASPFGSLVADLERALPAVSRAGSPPARSGRSSSNRDRNAQRR